MGDENPPRAIGDYSRPSHEGYRNTIELPDGNNVVPLRSNTIWRAIDYLTGGKLRDKSAKESWKIIKNLALYDHESWNDPRYLAKPIKAIYLPHGVPSTSNQAHLSPKPYVQVNKIASSYIEGLVSNFMASQDARLSKFEADFKQQQSEMTNQIDTLLKAINDRMTGALLSDTVKNRRGFLATVGAIIDCKKAKIAVGDGFTRLIFRVKEIGLEKDFMKDHLPGELEKARDAELNPFKDVLVFRKMMKFLGVIPINLKRNMRESKDLIKKKIDWKRPPKEGDGSTDHEGLIKEVIMETMMEPTLEEYVNRTRGDYYSGITKTMINGKATYELKAKFLNDLRSNAFSGTNGEDAVEHIKNFLKIVDPLELPNELKQSGIQLMLCLKIGWVQNLPTIRRWIHSPIIIYGIIGKRVMIKKYLPIRCFLNRRNLRRWGTKIAKIFRIETNIFDFETPLCTAFNEFNYLLKIDTALFTHDIQGAKTYEEYENELNDDLKNHGRKIEYHMN
uniref:MAK10-like protein n=1 Tax=Tanacetum cinerariifolium TaxID=118510 RepID=A0A6L2L3H6_TANCI|nr:MAK10-like protein [Tanacetum cinerariifolium]